MFKQTLSAAKDSFGQAYGTTFRSVARHSPVQFGRTAADGSVPVNLMTEGGDYIGLVDFTKIAQNSKRFARHSLPKAAKKLAARMVWNIAFLEVIDLMEDAYDRRQRNKKIAELIEKARAEGFTAELNDEMETLLRSKTRRTFGQFIRDLPYRTVRRVVRAAYVEAGWWIMVVTSPVWLPVLLADLAWSFVLVPVAAGVAKTVFGRDIDVTAAVAKPKPVVTWILGHTVFFGYGLLAKGVAMRLHNKTAVKANKDGYAFIDDAKDIAYQTISKITDGRTAFAWGEAAAEALDSFDLTVEQEMKAIAQMSYWVEENITADYRSAVLHGFWVGTPLVYRDLARAA